MYKPAKLLILLCSALVLAGCNNPPVNFKALNQKWADSPIEPQKRTYQVGERTIHFAEVNAVQAPRRVSGNDASPTTVIFVHGTPGNWLVYTDYLLDDRLNQRARLLAVDRAGFGKSADAGVETSLARHAAYLKPLLEKSPGKTILVGHSYGGPVIARLAMDYPKLVDGLVFIAASAEPDLSKARWYNHAANNLLIGWAVPKRLQLANKEILPIKDELEAMLPRWQQVDAHTLIVQGGRDKLVNPGNARFIESALEADNPVKLVWDDRAGHFILWKQKDRIVDEILALINRVESRTRDDLQLSLETPRLP